MDSDRARRGVRSAHRRRACSKREAPSARAPPTRERRQEFRTLAHVGLFQPALTDSARKVLAESLPQPSGGAAALSASAGAPPRPPAHARGASAGAASQLSARNPYVGSFAHAPRSEGFKELLWERPDDAVVDRLQVHTHKSLARRHLSQAEVDALPLRRRAADEPAAACVICIEDVAAGAELRGLPCGHEFHRACADRWLRGLRSNETCHTNACPVCRVSVLAASLSGSEALAASGSASASASLSGSGGGGGGGEEGLERLREEGAIPEFAFANLGATLMAELAPRSPPPPPPAARDRRVRAPAPAPAPVVVVGP